MRTLFQTIKTTIPGGKRSCTCFRLQHPQGLHQEVPVPACWSEKTAEFPEPSEVEL